MNKEVLTTSEINIMKGVWSSDHDLNIAELVDTINRITEKEYARTTIVTFLTRLELKGFVTTVRKGRLSYVHAVIPEEEYKSMLARRETDFWFDGNAAGYLAALFSGRKIGKEEMKTIEETLQALAE